MNSLTLPGLLHRGKVLLNPHFWILCLIIAILTFIYYVNLSMFDVPSLRGNWIWDLIVIEFNYGLNGSLFCIPFIYAAVIFGWRGILITWLSSMILLLPRISYLAYNTTVFVNNILFLLIPLLVVLILALQRHWREMIKKAAAEREKERQAYIGQILTAQEAERKRISREIHDDTTQKLWIVSNLIQGMISDKYTALSPEIAARLYDIRSMVIQISDDAKRLSLALRPGILDNLGLVPAMRLLVEQLNNEEKIEATFISEGTPRKVPDDICTHIYRITQEALNNVRRHSRANRVEVSIIFSPRKVKVLVRDNGVGISLRDINKLPAENKLGIIGMQERVRLLNGVFKLESGDDAGTTLSIEIQDIPDISDKWKVEMPECKKEA